MIPKLDFENQLKPEISHFLQQLKKNAAFKGEIRVEYPEKLLYATDNSVYQILPEAIIFPRSENDIAEIFKLAHQDAFHKIYFAPRGGGTGTNGQSLTDGIVIDCSKYLSKILEVNVKKGFAVVQAGVVLDQLNDTLRPLGYFFGPTCSPSSRATLGGMANTDASGKGSLIYGKTSTHVLEIKAVYTDGQVHTSHAIPVRELNRYKQLPGVVGHAYRQVDKTVKTHAALIKKQFPKLKRFMTGYNLAHVYKDKGTFNLNPIITGSEGTLTCITQLKLHILPIPAFRFIIVKKYPSFLEALKDAEKLIALQPSAIETMDETLLNLTKTDTLFPDLKTYLTFEGEIAGAINVIEFVANTQVDCKKEMARVQKACAHFAPHTFDLVHNKGVINKIWELRKKSVGLLAKLKGKRKPVSGMEDSIVPPKHLARYAKDLRKLLDAHQLIYSMYGHIDVGCIHLRPALDMTNPKDEALYYALSSKIAHLAKKNGGLMWGEHGKGFRSEYVPLFFGKSLYGELQKIKKSFDPFEQLNPGKIASDKPLRTIKEPLRGDKDKQILPVLRETYATPLSCNGNGTCFNYSAFHTMCPSYKATRDRIHSPKGRASLFREWLRLISITKKEGRFKRFRLCAKKDFSHQVFDAMAGCLGCRACVTDCPVHVNIPNIKTAFLAKYHTRYYRSLADMMIAQTENMSALLQGFPRLSNALLSNPLSRFLCKTGVKLVDLPVFAYPSLKHRLREHDIHPLSIQDAQTKIASLSPNARKKTVILMQDWLTSFYEPQLVIDTYLCMEKLGYRVILLSWFAQGQTFYVKGFLKKFRNIVQKNVDQLKPLCAMNIPLVGIEPSAVLCMRDEYAEMCGKESAIPVLLLQEWLGSIPLTSNKKRKKTTHHTLFSHCTEKSSCKETDALWGDIFKRVGLSLTPQTVGCCGMAGAYGHELNHQTHSKDLFNMSWKQNLKASVLVTGFSCRAQIARFSKVKATHPIQLLLRSLP